MPWMTRARLLNDETLFRSPNSQYNESMEEICGLIWLLRTQDILWLRLINNALRILMKELDLIVLVALPRACVRVRPTQKVVELIH